MKLPKLDLLALMLCSKRSWPNSMRDNQLLSFKFQNKEISLCDGYDAMLRSRSVIKASGRQDINVQSIILDHYLPPQPAEASEILLNQVNDCEIYDKVTVTAKVTTMHEAVQLTEKRKQDVSISDASGSAKLVLWEEDIDCVRAGKSYIMKNLIVGVYLGPKYLSKGVSTNIQQISDIGIMSSTSSTGDSAEELLNTTANYCRRSRAGNRQSMPQMKITSQTSVIHAKKLLQLSHDATIRCLPRAYCCKSSHCVQQWCWTRVTEPDDASLSTEQTDAKKVDWE